MIAGALMCADTYINNSIFINNKALGYEGSAEFEGEIINYNVSAMGGAIYTQGDIQLSNSIFINNSAYDGGTIYVECINKLNVDAVSSQKMEFLVGSNISNCIFDNNFALNNGNFIFIAPSYLYLYYEEEGWFNDETQEWETEPGWYYMGDTVYTGHDMKLDMVGNEHFIASLNTNNLIFENNFWSNNSQFDIHVHELHDVPFGPYGELDCSEIEDSTFYPTSWVVMNINGPNVVSGPANYNVTLNTLNNGSEIEGSLPDYEFGIRCNNGELNISEITISNGIAYFTYTPQSSTSDVITVYSGEQNIATKDISITKIDPTVVISDSNVVYAEDVVINVTLPSNATGNVTLTIDGKTYTSSIKEGVATFNIKNLNVGTYNITVSYKGDNNYNNASNTATLKVNKATVTIAPTALSTTYNSGKVFQVKVVDNNQNPVSGLKLALKVYTGSSYQTVYVTTDASGIAKYSASKLAIGTHNVVVSLSHTNYVADSKTSSIKISKATVTIIPTALNTTYDSGKYFQVKVLDANKKAVSGLKLTLKIYTGSKVTSTVTVTTNASGIAKYSASKLSIGTHKVIVSLSNTYYTASSKTSYIKVSKAPTTVTAPVVKYKKGANKYFKVTVKNKATGKVVKSLAIKIKVYTGKKYKTYTVKTNTNGIAQLSTRYLAKGTHKVVISSGNSKYTVSKSGKLIVIK